MRTSHAPARGATSAPFLITIALVLTLALAGCSTSTTLPASYTGEHVHRPSSSVLPWTESRPIATHTPGSVPSLVARRSP